MTEARREIRNPMTGERIVITATGLETSGCLLAFDVFLPPGAHVPAGHVHPNQEERFTVIRGSVRFKIDGRTILAGPNDVVSVERGTPHWFGNAGAAEAHIAVEVRPALRMQELLERTAMLSQTGGLPNLPDLAAMLLDFHRELCIPRVPRSLRSLVNAMLRPLALLSRGRAT